ncbi:MAG: hypothetical protein AAGJ46_00775 [Planctomycetota bacterium]
MTDCSWRIDGVKAECLALGARIDLSHPGDGVRLGSAVQAFGVRPAVEDAMFPLVDYYARGTDLVASYGPCDAFPFRTEVYWRGDGVGLQFIVSVETDLLDSHPVILVLSRVSACGGVDSDYAPRMSEERVVRVQQLGGGDWCEVVHPSDQREASHKWRFLQGGIGESRWSLFSQSLEKGVIRRARLACRLFDSDDSNTVSSWASEFAEQSIPLTV